MDKTKILIEKHLKEYKINKARITFLESRIKRNSAGDLEPNGQLWLLAAGKGSHAEITGVKEKSEGYSTEASNNFHGFADEARKELDMLVCITGVIEDALVVLDRIDSRYSVIIEKYYIEGCKMEEIAHSIHTSRSRCYELCREAAGCMEKIIYGERAYTQEEEALFSRNMIQAAYA